MDGGGKMPHRVECAFETDPPQVGSVVVGSLLHQEPDQVVGDDVHDCFLFDQFRALAAQDVQSEQDFDLVEVQLTDQRCP